MLECAGRSGIGLLAAWWGAGVCWGAPVVQPWGDAAPADVEAVAAARLSGWYASSETAGDSVEIRDVRQDLLRRITRDEIAVLAPWMSLDAGRDGPRALAWTDSGRSLFIVVTDDAPSPDGLGSDAVLRYDTTSGRLSRFTRAEIGGSAGEGPCAMHYGGALWVSTETGGVRVYDAGRNDTAGFLRYTWSLPGGEPARGFGVSRSLGLAFVVSDSALYRVDLSQQFATPVVVGPVSGGLGVGFSDHFGAPVREGVYLVEAADAGQGARVLHISSAQATGFLAYAPSVYVTSDDEVRGLAPTACGGFLLAGPAGLKRLSESDDPRLDYESWLRDEFEQAVAFGAGLVAPDGQPPGWVTDADVATGGTRFHPASPDGAAWVVMLHIAQDHLAGDEGSSPIVRDILRRYAGLMPDGIVPQVTNDGIFRHWYDPQSGGAAPGWSGEYATLSTMLLVAAADRARRFYADEPDIVEAAGAIVGRVRNWDGYIQPVSQDLYLRAAASGGPDFGTASGAFHEGVMFVEQASVYGSADSAFAHWLDRGALPAAEYVSGFPVTTNRPGGHLPAFVSLYPWLAQAAMRADASWEDHMRNLLASNGAWTDDHAPKYMTVFSAGTTRPDWGGYHADSLSDHPGDVTTFPSLMAFGSLGETAPSVAAYHAYRLGARQMFATGASILFRRSEIDPGYTPPDAGLPDVAIGALGLAELIHPGTVDAVLAVGYRGACPADMAAPDGVLNFFDVAAYIDAYLAREPRSDLVRPFGRFNFFDVSAYLDAYTSGCP